MTLLARCSSAESIDQRYLRIVCDVLTSLVDELDTAPVDGADMRARLVQHRQLLRHQMRDAGLSAGLGRPLVLDPAQLASVMSRQGQPLTPVVTIGTVPTNVLSSAEVRMPPLHTSKAHVHHGTDIVLIVMTGQAITLWWDDGGVMHKLSQQAGQHLFMPHGVPHAAINPGATETVGTEIRSNPDFSSDNELLPHLDPPVMATMAAILAQA